MARRDHPGLRFDVGTMTALESADGELGGIVAWYSIIHTPPEVLPTVFAEFHRVLAPGGHLLLGFHVGDERRRKETGYGGHAMTLDVHLLPPDRIAESATRAGLVVHATPIREPEGARIPQCLPSGAQTEEFITVERQRNESGRSRATASIPRRSSTLLDAPESRWEIRGAVAPHDVRTAPVLHTPRSGRAHVADI
ncbi:class I SAM-dependent methyltransferase [Streptomyces sp. NPDC005065]|uniref:class I SAM-dependent methyltransferase n=1 Tax=Streptomyces sp. NPDC005065 TaxID=3154461 RepID=UPI0033ABB016